MPEIDVDRLEEFFAAVVGEEGMIELRVGGEWRLFAESPAKAAEAAAEKASELIESGGPQATGTSLWFGVAPRVEGSTSGAANDCYAPRSLFIDIDSYPTYDEIEMSEAFLAIGLPEPTFVVATGAGHHLYWRIKESLTTEQWVPLQASLVGLFAAHGKRVKAAWAADEPVKDPTRVMQVPGVPNFKHGLGRIAQILDSFSTEGTYSVSDMDIGAERRAEATREFSLPEKLIGIGVNCNYPNGGQDQAIMEFAFNCFHHRNIPYHQAMQEGRAYFCDPAFCEPVVTFADMQGKISRAYAANQERRRQFAERNQRAPAERVGQEPVTIPQAAIWICENHLSTRAKHVEGMGLMVYSPRDSRFLGGVHAKQQVRGGLTAMAEQHPEFANALLDLHAGSKFSALHDEVQSRSVRVPVDAISAEHGIIPLHHGKVLNILNGKVEDRSEDPPFFNWLSPANENDLTSAIFTEKYGAWTEFLESSVPDEEEREYLGRLMYYAAIGGNHLRVFIMLHGKGSTGKNVFFESVTRAIQGEVLCAPRNLVCQSHREYDLTSQINLSGYRAVYCDEINRNDKLDTSRVKALTSDSGIKARAAYAKEDAKSSNSFVLALLTNYLPELEEPDEALMNRLHFVTFRVDHRDPDRSLIEGDRRPCIDPTLKDRIKPHHVLAWIANHREAYEKHRLSIPPTFMEELKGWFRTVDSVGTWATDMLECVGKGDGYKVKASDLLDHFLRDMGKSRKDMSLVAFKAKLAEFFGRKAWAVEDVVIDRAAAYDGLRYGGEVRVE